MTRRIDAVILQAIVIEYDDTGRPVGEALTQPIKVYRAKLADLDVELQKLDAQLVAKGT